MTVTDRPTTTRQLTTAQIGVLAGYARGWPTDRVATALAISPKTVRGHVRRATERLGIKNARPLPALVHHAYTHCDFVGIPELAVLDHPTPSKMRLPDFQNQVLQGIAHGLSMDAIASELGVEKGVANTHRRNLFTRLGTSRAEHAVALAWQAGLLPHMPPPARSSRAVGLRPAGAVR
ncbi:LuxR C-terminal-related transcriptional regulator [Streptomyces fagopyri]|uniref:LuxR C-terminal-related transcriptional regulator n=1 Tax=Streptomyces fagopyri TaxID=2662397 RepID=UPI00368427B2